MHSGQPNEERRVFHAGMSRRQAVANIVGAVLGTMATACTPLKIALKAYPEQFASDGELKERILRAFVLTIIPIAPAGDANLTRALQDPYFKLAEYSPYLAADLCHRSYRATGDPHFDRLGSQERTAIVQEAVSDEGVSGRLYTGAVFLSQVAFYAGIYTPETGCPAIGYEGRYRYRPIEAITFPEPQRLLPDPSTIDGNPA